MGASRGDVVGPRNRPTRTSPIRLTLVGIFVIPLVSLVALWGIAADTTLGPSIQERNYQQEYTTVGGPALTLGSSLAQERLQSFIWLSTGSRAPRIQIDQQRARTDTAIAGFKAAVASGVVKFQSAKPLLDKFYSQLDRLGTVRAAIDAKTITALGAFEAYNSIVDAQFQFYYTASFVPDGLLYGQTVATLQANYALELAGREAALVGGALAARDRMSAAERQLFAQSVANQRYLIGQSLTQLDSQLRAPFAHVYASPAYASFKAMEDRITSSTRSSGPVPVSAQAWATAAQQFLGSFEAAESTETSALAQQGTSLANALQRRLILAGAIGLAAVLLSIFLMLRFGRRISRELTALLRAARSLTQERLPIVVSRLSRGENVDVAREAPPLNIRARTDEVAKIAQAFSAAQRTAVEAAVGQADLRGSVSQVFRSLARRNQSLLQRQLRMLDSMEERTDEPDALADLFRLDHMTTRMRRHAESLIVLSGAAPGRGWRSPVPIVEVLRGAIGEIEDYVRIDLITDSTDAVAGAAVADVVHLLAELIENAAVYSPPNTHVRVRAERVGSGFVVEIEDRGIGLPEDRLAAINQRLAHPPEFDLADSDQLGLFVVSQLAARHGIRVLLRGSPYGGTTAIVLMPFGIIVAGADADGADAGAGDLDRAPISGTGNGAGPQGAPRPVDSHPEFPDDGPEYPGRSPSGPPLTVEPILQQHHESPAPEVQGPGAAADRGLPRRVRQASLAPQLRDHPPAANASNTGNGAGGTRSPDQVRALVSAIQQGWRHGNAGSGPEGGGFAGAHRRDFDLEDGEGQ